MSSQRIKELNEQRSALATEARALNAKDKLDAAETKRFNEIIKRGYDAKLEIEQIESRGGENRGLPREMINAGAAITEGAAFGPEQRMANVVKDDRFSWVGTRRLSIGKMLRGMVTGEWSGADDEQRALSISTAANGGLLVPTPISSEIIDLARNKSVCMAAGARTIPMTASTLKMARVTADPTIGWKQENAAFANGDATWEAMTFTAKTLGGVAKMSVELAEDVADLDHSISDQFAKAIAVELDRVGLRGSGTDPEPKGVKNFSGIQTVATVGDVTNYSKFSAAVQTIAQANGAATGIIVAPRTMGDLDRAADTLGQPLRKPPSLENLPFYSTNNIPTNLGSGTDESEGYVGDWTQLLYGIRTQLFMEISREAADSTNSAFRNGQVWIRCYLRGDVQVARPAHFCLMSGLTSPA